MRLCSGAFASCNPVRVIVDSTNLLPLLEAIAPTTKAKESPISHSLSPEGGQMSPTISNTGLDADDGISVFNGFLACQDQLSTATTSSTLLTATESLVMSTSLLDRPFRTHRRLS
jgi:hypothetical protein